MKTNKRTLRVIAVSVILLFAASARENKAQAGCSVSSGDYTVSCSGSESYCRVDGLVSDALVCDGNNVSVKSTFQQCVR